MTQRRILNSISLDFKRDRQTSDEFLKKTIERTCSGIREYLELSRQDGFILGLSGGLDSFVCAALIANAGVKVHLLMLPNGTQSDISDSIECADALIKRFGDLVSVEEVNIAPAFAGMCKTLYASELFDESNKYSLGNTAARLRMVTQYALNKDLLVCGTDHAAENLTGYFTKFGDGASDFNPIDGLIKDDLYAIARRFGAPECVLKKAPAAGLGISESDEAEMGVKYSEIYDYLRGNKISERSTGILERLYAVSAHKRRTAPSPLNRNWEAPTPVSHVVVDITHAFYDGGLPCLNAKEAARNSANYINQHSEQAVLYVRDFHPPDHCSFTQNGGIWPPHGVQGTGEVEFLDDFHELKKTINTPLENYNIFNKGEILEEYSGFNAKNAVWGALSDNLEKKVVVSGIATEYCVKNTVVDLVNAGFEVTVLADALGYVDLEGHLNTFSEFGEMGVRVICDWDVSENEKAFMIES